MDDTRASNLPMVSTYQAKVELYQLEAHHDRLVLELVA